MVQVMVLNNTLLFYNTQTIQHNVIQLVMKSTDFVCCNITIIIITIKRVPLRSLANGIMYRLFPIYRKFVSTVVLSRLKVKFFNLVVFEL